MKKRTSEHLVFINALREVLGLGPIPYSGTPDESIHQWWASVPSQGSRKLNPEAFIDELKVVE